MLVAIDDSSAESFYVRGPGGGHTGAKGRWTPDQVRGDGVSSGVTGFRSGVTFFSSGVMGFRPGVIRAMTKRDPESSSGLTDWAFRVTSERSGVTCFSFRVAFFSVGVTGARFVRY